MPNVKDDDAKRGREDQPRGRADKKSDGQDEKSRDIPAVVDRIEDGDVAVLSLGGGDETLDLPLSRLPEGTRDGDHLRLTFDGEPSEKTLTRAVEDARARADAAERVRRVQERLEKTSGTQGKKDFKL